MLVEPKEEELAEEVSGLVELDGIGKEFVVPEFITEDGDGA